MAVEIVMPHLSDSMEEGLIVQWFVAEGDAVGEGDPLVEVETDKATVTYEAEQAGTVLLLTAAVGATVPVGAVIAAIGQAGEAYAPAGAVATTSATKGSASEVGSEGAAEARGGGAVGAATSAGSPVTGRVRASPLARRIAASLGISLSDLAGSGPQGRVIRADVERHAATGNGGAGGASQQEVAPAVGSAKGTVVIERPSRLQQTIARRMSESRATVPDFELRSEIDMQQAVALREQMRALVERPPSYNDFIVKAVALALREFPRVNGAYRDGVVERYSRINVGIAVAADDGLVVPTIFDADVKSVFEIGTAARELAAKVRDGSVTPAELSGTTFSVSNLGMFGVDSFSAVVNAPQAAILAVGSLRQRPWVDEASGALVARPTIHLSLACDHRILYGADGARFLARVRELLEKPVALLL